MRACGLWVTTKFRSWDHESFLCEYFFRRPELEFNNTKFVLLICELLYLLVLLLKSKEFGVLTFLEKAPPVLACFRN